jgi:hypothetical protein
MAVPSQVNLYIDESCVGPDWILIAAVAVDNLEYERFISEKLEAKKSSKPYVMQGAVLHHTEDNMSINHDMAAWVLRTAPMSVYYLLQHYNPEAMDEVTAKRWVYEQIFPKKILLNIITKYRKLNPKVSIDIAFENLTDKPGSDIKFFEPTVASLGFNNTSVRVVDKSNVLVALPDYMAGTLRDCIEESRLGKGTAATTNMTLVKDKTGLLVVCFDNGKCRYYERGDEMRAFIEQGCPLGE